MTKGAPTERRPLALNYFDFFSLVLDEEFFNASALFSPAVLIASALFSAAFLTAEALFSALFIMLAASFSPAAVTFSAAFSALASTEDAWFSAGLFLLHAASAMTATAMIMVVLVFIGFPLSCARLGQ